MFQLPGQGIKPALVRLDVPAECLTDGLRHTHTLGGCPKQRVTLEFRIESN